MIKKGILAITTAMTFLFAGGVFQGVAAEYDHELKDKNMSFAWKVDGENLAVKLSAKTKGWVGIGFNPTKAMLGGNFILGYVKKGKAKLIDEFGVDENSHKSDKKLGGTTDVTLVGGTEEGGMTTVEFTLPLQAADNHDTTINAGGDNTVLLAYGAGRDSFKAKHKYRGSFTVNFATGASAKVK